MNPILDVATQTNWHHAHQCVYVGMTGLTPEERFQKHLRGEKDAWFVHKYGQRLLPEVRPFRLGSPCGPCGDDTLRTSVNRSEVPR